MNDFQNVREMIDAFDAFISAEDYSTKASDNLLRYLLDRSSRPAVQVDMSKDNPFEGVHREDFLGKDPHEKELEEIKKLLRDREGEIRLEEIRKFPPVLLEQLLIVAMAVYVIREKRVSFTFNGIEFNDFYKGWGAVVLLAY